MGDHTIPWPARGHGLCHSTPAALSFIAPWSSHPTQVQVTDYRPPHTHQPASSGSKSISLSAAPSSSVSLPSLRPSLDSLSYRFFPPDIVPLLRFRPSLSAPISPSPSLCLCVLSISAQQPARLVAVSQDSQSPSPKAQQEKKTKRERKDCGNPLPYLPN